MHVKWLAALVVGVAIGVAVPSLLPRQEAQARQQDSQAKPTKWQYQVMWFSVRGAEANPNDTAKDLGTEMNKLAKDGWEFVEATVPNGGFNGSYLLFRRPRK
jgi:hypothetical protein